MCRLERVHVAVVHGGTTDRAAGLSRRGTCRFFLLLAPVRPAHDAEFPAELLHSSDGDAELLGRLALPAIEEALDGMPVDLEGGAPSREGVSELAGLPSREEKNLHGLRAPRGAVWSVGVHQGTRGGSGTNQNFLGIDVLLHRLNSSSLEPQFLCVFSLCECSCV